MKFDDIVHFTGGPPLPLGLSPPLRGERGTPLSASSAIVEDQDRGHPPRAPRVIIVVHGGGGGMGGGLAHIRRSGSVAGYLIARGSGLGMHTRVRNLPNSAAVKSYESRSRG